MEIGYICLICLAIFMLLCIFVPVIISNLTSGSDKTPLSTTPPPGFIRM
jgi:hypothetical protein